MSRTTPALAARPARSADFGLASRGRRLSRIASATTVGLALAALAALPWWSGFATQRLLAEAFALFAIALAWNLLAGYGGLVAVGQHAFVGVGAYTLFALSERFGLNPWAAAPSAALAGALFALATAWPMFRLRGAYFAVGTWVVAEMTRILAMNSSWLGAGSGIGLSSMAEYDRWTRNAGVYWAALATGALSLLLARSLLRGRLGLALTSLRDSEPAAAASGVDVGRAKLALWVIAGGIAGVAGAVSFMGTLRVSPDAAFSINWTAAAIFIAVLGGIGTLEGPLIGTLLYFVLRELFAEYGSSYLIGLGLLAVLAMVLAPGGAWSFIARNRSFDPFRVRRRMPVAVSLETKTGVAPTDIASLRSDRQEADQRIDRPSRSTPPDSPLRRNSVKGVNMGIAHPKYKVAVVQAAPAWLDLEGTVDKTVALIDEAAASGAKLIAFPELWIPGYPWHIWMGAPAWAIGRGFVQRYFDNSLSYEAPQADRIRKAVKKAALTAVIGLSERDGGSLYIAQWFIGPDGETIAQRRKLRPTHAERTVFGEGDGSHIAVHDRADIGRVGGLCCWEHLQPLTKYAMYAQNEQVHIAAWPSFSMYEPFAHALGWETNNAASKVYAVEGSCFVLAPCSIISQAMVDELCDSEDKKALVHAGGGHAVIYGPDGSPLAAKLPETQEGILYADVDLGMIGVAKNAADPAGHYSRPDVTRLLFNNKPARRVEHFSLPVDAPEPRTEVPAADAPLPR